MKLSKFVCHHIGAGAVVSRPVDAVSAAATAVTSRQSEGAASFESRLEYQGSEHGGCMHGDGQEGLGSGGLWRGVVRNGCEVGRGRGSSVGVQVGVLNKCSDSAAGAGVSPPGTATIQSGHMGEGASGVEKRKGRAEASEVDLQKARAGKKARVR